MTLQFIHGNKPPPCPPNIYTDTPQYNRMQRMCVGNELLLECKTEHPGRLL